MEMIQIWLGIQYILLTFTGHPLESLRIQWKPIDFRCASLGIHGIDWLAMGTHWIPLSSNGNAVESSEYPFRFIDMQRWSVGFNWIPMVTDSEALIPTGNPLTIIDFQRSPTGVHEILMDSRWSSPNSKGIALDSIEYQWESTGF